MYINWGSATSRKLCQLPIKKTQKLATKFNTEWTKTRPWLIYVNNEGMFCTFCQKYNKLPFGRTAWNTSPCTCITLLFSQVSKHEIMQV